MHALTWGSAVRIRDLMAGIITNLWYGDKMDSKELKKMLAGLSLVALIGGAGLSVSGCATTGSSS